MKKENRGGARPNAGRKPIKDKKMQLYVYVRQSKIDLHGGKDELKQKIHKLIDKK
jgi:hypothetical protein